MILIREVITVWSPVCDVFTDTDNLPVTTTQRYYVKQDYDSTIGNSYWVYIHYPTTEPDTPYMVFRIKKNADLVCAVLNADKQGVVYENSKT